MGFCFYLKSHHYSIQRFPVLNNDILREIADPSLPAYGSFTVDQDDKEQCKRLIHSLLQGNKSIHLQHGIEKVINLDRKLYFSMILEYGNRESDLIKLFPKNVKMIIYRAKDLVKWYKHCDNWKEFSSIIPNHLIGMNTYKELIIYSIDEPFALLDDSQLTPNVVKKWFEKRLPSIDFDAIYKMNKLKMLNESWFLDIASNYLNPKYIYQLAKDGIVFNFNREQKKNIYIAYPAFVKHLFTVGIIENDMGLLKEFLHLDYYGLPGIVDIIDNEESENELKAVALQSLEASL